MDGAVGVTAIETTVDLFLLPLHPARTNMQRAATAKAPESRRVKFDMITPPNKVRTPKIFVHTRRKATSRRERNALAFVRESAPETELARVSIRQCLGTFVRAA